MAFDYNFLSFSLYSDVLVPGHHNIRLKVYKCGRRFLVERFPALEWVVELLLWQVHKHTCYLSSKIFANYMLHILVYCVSDMLNPHRLVSRCIPFRLQKLLNITHKLCGDRGWYGCTWEYEWVSIFFFLHWVNFGEIIGVFGFFFWGRVHQKFTRLFGQSLFEESLIFLFHRVSDFRWGKASGLIRYRGTIYML